MNVPPAATTSLKDRLVTGIALLVNGGWTAH